MSSGQTLITIFALMLLTTILLNFYKLLNANGDIVNSGQDGIMMSTMATSYIELASALSYDSVTDTSTIALRDPTKLTPASKLGSETADEDSLFDYNDYDDFNGPSRTGTTIDKQANGTSRTYRLSFKVQYVSPSDVSVTSSTQTFVKRLDIKVWRIFPSGETDTLKVSSIKGYYTFE